MRGDRSDRRGSALVLAMVLGVVCFIVIGGLEYSVAADALAAANMVREIRAQALADGIIASVDAAALSQPWARRPWSLHGRWPGAQAPTSSLTLAASGTERPFPWPWVPEHASARVTVEDQADAPRSYRVRAEITLAGHRYAFSWARRMISDLGEDMPRDAVGPMRRETPGLEPIASQLALAKVTAHAGAPGPGAVPDDQAQTLSQLDRDLKQDATAQALTLPVPSRPTVAPLVFPGVNTKEVPR